MSSLCMTYCFISYLEQFPDIGDPLHCVATNKHCNEKIGSLHSFESVKFKQIYDPTCNNAHRYLSKSDLLLMQLEAICSQVV